MGATYTTDIVKLEMGDFDPATGTLKASTLVEIPIQKGSLKLEEQQGNKQEYFQAGVATAVKTTYQPGSESMEAEVLDTSAAVKARIIGGTTSTLDGKTSWSRPDGIRKPITKYVKATTDDGGTIVYNKASVFGVRSFAGGDNGIAVLKLTITPQATGVANVPAVVETDPS